MGPEKRKSWTATWMDWLGGMEERYERRMDMEGCTGKYI
jgi:hypothetical protein